MELQEEKEFELFLQRNQDKIILIKFSTTWCPPCKELQKSIGQLQKEREDIEVLEIDAERFPELAQRPEFSVRSVPTLILWRRGNAIRTIDQLKRFISGS